ncbi:acetate/propionate family kinase [Novispirillum sp. DQ9]|uniref:acetate/propionate family kinase n=1 Tax=Novispirillum sp. DQ9 TaxID=3398612 RepID=UPI003C7A5A4A
MSKGILVINAGSSSIKFSVYLADDGLRLVTKGQLEGIGVGITPHFKAVEADGTPLADEAWEPVAVGGQTRVLGRLIDWIEDHLGDATLMAAGHRVVHGGGKYGRPVVVGGTVLSDLESYVSLAPLHQPHNLAPIKAIAELHPDLPQVACFDTAFHMTKRHEAEMFALPRAYTDKGIRRYGFHGLSYEYIAHALKTVAPEVALGRVVVCHLGSGASMCALKGGTSVDSSMGFTAVDGLMMGTRTGSLDPGVVLHLVQHEGLDAKALEKLLYKESGLLGVSGGLSNDMRVLLGSDKPEAREAVDLFVYRICKEIGALASTIGGIDALVFTAGIGEHAAPVRKRVCEASAWLGITLDEAANAKDATRISTPGSTVQALVIPTDEELMIARHTQGLVLETV